jgi:beta-phosphoglucomutase-like phosphatase (HAD superfamily)
LTTAVKNWIDFGLTAAKAGLYLGIGTFIVGSLFVLRKALYMRWKSWLLNLARKIYNTDLPGILSVIVANRQILLEQFGESVKKMLAAIGLHTDKVERRKKAMQENLQYAELFLKKSQNESLSASERKIAEDNSKHYASEAAKDKSTLEGMLAEADKRRKSYDFFERMLNGLRNDTSSITNEIDRLKENLETSTTWKEAADSALKLVGVDPTEKIVIEETRKKIAENEAAVVSMIMDNQSLLEKMEMKQDILDESGQLLLDQYSKKIDVMAFTDVSSIPSANKQPVRGSDFLKNYGNLIK